MRVFSNFTVKYNDGTLARVPVMYGDAERQASTIIRQNSENKINSVPRMSVYISGLELDSIRLADPTFVGSMRITERDITGNAYNNSYGRNYTVERLMPTPFKLSMKLDVWTANTDQKLQLLEQMLVLFNPSLELQTNDNYIDWTNISVLHIKNLSWSSKSVPVGTDTPIDIATIELETPIWISPPVKVKQMGVITNIITSVFSNATSTYAIDGFGNDSNIMTSNLDSILTQDRVTISDYKIEVYNNQISLLGATENVLPAEPTVNIPVRQGVPINWDDLLTRYPGKFTSGASKIFLTQSNGISIVGVVSLNADNHSILDVVWDQDSLVQDTLIDSNGFMFGDPGFDQASSRGRVDAIIDPLTYNPKRPLKELDDQPIILGIRYLIIEDIGDVDNVDGADAWKGLDGSDLVAHANDLIEWNGTKWNVIFDSVNESDTMVWQTNIYTGIQYLWNGVSWIKSFEGVYEKGYWRLEL